jgi:hypothetical protein
LCRKFGRRVITRLFSPSEIKVSPFLDLDNEILSKQAHCLEQAHYRGAHSMTPDGFVTDQQPLPSFLSADKTEPQDVGILWEAAAISSRVVKMSILAASAALIGIVTLEVVHPVTRVPKFMAPLIDMAAGQRDASPSTPRLRSGADAEVSASLAGDGPARDETPAAPQPTGQTQTEGNGLSSEALFREFQIWALRQTLRGQIEPLPPEEAGPAPIAVDAPMPAPPLQKPRKPKPAQSVQAQAPHIPIPRARLQWGQMAHVDGRPVQDPRGQDQASQTAPPPSWLQSLSSHQ